MAFTVTHSYDVSVDVLFKVFTDQEYLQKKYEATSGTNIEFMELGEKDGKFVVKVKRDVPSNPPGFAKKFLKSTNTIIETDIWELNDNEVKKGTFEVEVKGTPISLSGTITISPAEGGGSNNVVETTAKVSIPLVGGKIANFVEGDAQKNLDDDYNFTKPYTDNLK